MISNVFFGSWYPARRLVRLDEDDPQIFPKITYVSTYVEEFSTDGLLLFFFGALRDEGDFERLLWMRFSVLPPQIVRPHSSQNGSSPS